MNSFCNIARLGVAALALAVAAPGFGATGRWEYAADGRPPEGLDSGRDRRLCEALLERLNSVAWSEGDARPSDDLWGVLVTYPKFTEPVWEVLDPGKYRTLLARVYQYRQMGHERYFRQGSTEPADLKPFLERVDRFVAEGWMFEKLTGPMLYHREEGGAISGPERTAIQQRIARESPSSSIRLGLALPDHYSLFLGFANADLTGPDPSVDPSNVGLPTASSSLQFFEGTPYFISNYGYLWRPGQATDLVQACAFAYKPSDSPRK